MIWWSKMILLYALISLLYATAVEARRGGGGRGSSVDLDLYPLDTATFTIAVLAAIFSFILLLGALGSFKKRPVEDDYPRRAWAAALLTLTTICITTSWSLYAYTVSQLSPSAVGDPVTVGLCSIVEGFLFRIAHIPFVGALLVILDWRAHQQAAQYGHARSKHFATMVRFGISSFLFVILVFAIARAGVEGSLYTSNQLLSLSFYQATINTSHALSQVIIAFSILAVVATVGTAIVLWTNRRPESSTLEIAQFDDRVLKRILYDISPFLVIQAIYELIADILSVSSVNIAPQVFRLADAIIEGLILLIITVALGLGMRPKKEREAEQVVAEAKG